MVEHLYIEYKEKKGFSLWYNCRDSQGRPYQTFASAKDREMVWMSECAGEVKALAASLLNFNKQAARSVFPRMKTTAISSIYDCPVKYWSRYSDGYSFNPHPSPTVACAESFTRFVETSNIKQVCLRYAAGPVSIVKGSSPRENRAEVICHFDETLQALCCCNGSPTRWIYEGSPDEDWEEIFYGVLEKTQALAGVNNTFTKDFANTINIGIYCSTDKIGSRFVYQHGGQRPIILRLLADQYASLAPDSPTVDAQHAIASKLSPIFQAAIRELSRQVDIVTWYASPAAPICDACGSGQPTN